MWSQLLKYKHILQFKLDLNWIAYFIVKMIGPCLIKNKKTQNIAFILQSLNPDLTDAMQFKPTLFSSGSVHQEAGSTVSTSVHKEGRSKCSGFSRCSFQLTQMLLWTPQPAPNGTLTCKKGFRTLVQHHVPNSYIGDFKPLGNLIKVLKCRSCLFQRR